MHPFILTAGIFALLIFFGRNFLESSESEPCERKSNEHVVLDGDQCEELECVECGRHPTPGDIVHHSCLESGLYFCSEKCMEDNIAWMINEARI